MSTLSMTRGDSATFQTTISNLPQGGLTSQFSIWFTAKRDATDADSAAVFQKTYLNGTGSGISFTAGGNVVTTTLAPSDTEGLPAGYACTLVFDVKIKDGTGTETTVDGGTITVYADVTQAY